MREILNYLPREVLVVLILALIALGGVFIRIVISHAKRQIKEQQLSFQNVIKTLNEIKESLKINTFLTNTCIYNDLDNMLRKAEVTGVWSSSLSQQFEEMYNRYLDAGDGIDNGQSLRKRADAIEINENKYIEYMHKYNNYKKNLFEE